MFTNNKFAKMDSIANLINTILETDTKAKMEELKGGQHKIDKNKNNKIDAQDFEILRGEKKAMKKEESEQVDEAVDMSDAKSVAGHLAKKAISQHGISNPTRAAHHAKNADAIEKTIDRVKRSLTPSSLVKAHTEVGSVRAAQRHINVRRAMSSAEKSAHKTLQAGVVKHLEKHLDQHKAAFRNAAAKYAAKNEEYEQVDEAVDMSDAKSVAAHLAKKAISLHGISNPTRAAHHAKNADAIEKTIDRVKRSGSSSSLAKAHTEVGSVSTAVRRMNVAKKMSSAEKSAHKSLQSGVVKHLQKHLDQHHAAFRNAAAKFAAKNEEYEQVDEAKEPGFRVSYGIGRKSTVAKKPETYGKRVQGKGYDKPENERKGPEGNVAMTSLMPGHDERAAKFLARQAKGTLVKGKAQSAKQMEKEEIDPKKTMTDTLKGREKDSSNPFLSKKVMMDVPGNVKENIEQVDERTLTAPETAEKEKLVKGMKPYLSKFTKRYGAEKGKSVMYGRATNLAKKNK